MSSLIKNLCWKEFHELKWGTVAAAAIVLAIPLCDIFRDAGAAYFGVHTSLSIYPLLAGVFFGMRAAAGERTSRTASFVAALPVSHRLLGASRLAATLIAAVVPAVALLLLGVILSLLTDQNTLPTPTNQNTWNGVLPLAVVFGLSILGTVGCISIVAVAGLGQPTEVRAAVVG
ncbi:MAG TPA: hypothetical protein VKH44_12685, partial [Pirellulaceae bacterium]|nr:hypothetical protein [Pirellulaceae bacterium]